MDVVVAHMYYIYMLATLIPSEDSTNLISRRMRKHYNLQCVLLPQEPMGSVTCANSRLKINLLPLILLIELWRNVYSYVWKIKIKTKCKERKTKAFEYLKHSRPKSHFRLCFSRECYLIFFCCFLFSRLSLRSFSFLFVNSAHRFTWGNKFPMVIVE